jgi:2-oxoglutarate ferredoxin oxidoreductase subunit beta
MAYDYEKSIRPGKLPHIWCPGCGHGIVMKGLIRAMDTCELDRKNTAIVACTLHTAHGRAAAFATGVKMAKPEMNVICCGGDGDGTAIGGNHFIHACRRNIDMTYVLMNNYIYGMTGGTPTGHNASTTPYGNPDPIFDISKLAIGAGATFVARTTAAHPREIDKLIVKGIQHKGMAIIEVIDDCPTTYGRRNKFRSVVDMMKRLKTEAVPVKAAAKMTAEQLEGKFLTGVLFEDTEKPEYCVQYADVIKKAQGA